MGKYNHADGRLISIYVNLNLSGEIKMISMKQPSYSKDEFKNLVARRLSQIRNLRGHSLEKVAEEVKILTPQQVHNHEIAASNVLPFHLELYAKLYNVPISYFFGYNDNKEFLEMNRDKRNMMISVEVAKTPDEVKHLMYHLAKAINKIADNTDKAEQVAWFSSQIRPLSPNGPRINPTLGPFLIFPYLYMITFPCDHFYEL